jgi:hypothetical protein
MTKKTSELEQFWIYCLDNETGLRFFFPFSAYSVEDCLNQIMVRQILKPGIVIERIDP